MHDGFGHKVADGFVDNAHVGVHQVPDCFHLAFQLRVHAARLVHLAVLAMGMDGIGIIIDL